MIKKVIFSILTISILTHSLFAEEPIESETEVSKENVAAKKDIIVETSGEFSQIFQTGIIDSSVSKSFDSEAFESSTVVSGGASVIFGVYALTFNIKDTFIPFYTTGTNVFAYQNTIEGRVGNSFIIDPSFKLFVDLKAEYENKFIPSSDATGTLIIEPVFGAKFSVEMISFSISQGIPLTIDLTNASISSVEIDGLYELDVRTGLGLNLEAKYNLVAPIDPLGQTDINPEQELLVRALWPIQSLTPQVGTILFNDSDKFIWGFTAGIGIVNESWIITGEYQGGYNFTSTLWENLFVASFALKL